MKARSGKQPFTMILAILLLMRAPGFASDPKPSPTDWKEAVATVEGEPITLGDLNRALASSTTKSHSEVLRRLINTRLILKEARSIGIHELPEIKKMVNGFSKATLREMLMERYVKDIKADEDEVEKLYKETVQEWKIRTVLFDKAEDAKGFGEGIKAGGNFDEMAKRLIKDGTAKVDQEGVFVKGKSLPPPIAEVLSKLRPGSVSPPTPFMSGFVVMKLEETRFPEDPEAREWAKQEVLNRKKNQALKDHSSSLIKKYIKVHKSVLDSLDVESTQLGFEAMLKDKQVVAEVKGERPVTVGDLAEALEQKFYHGVSLAVESKQIDKKKVAGVFDELLQKRAFTKEALRQGIDKTEVYKNRVKEYENSVVFGAFLQKVVQPDVKLGEEELKTYYNEHRDEISYPETVRIDSISFATKNEAEAALDKLQKGTDFKWLKALAQGRGDRPVDEDVTFKGPVLVTRDLPEDFRKVVSEAHSGDYRLYTSSNGYFYVLYIEEATSSKPRPFDEVKGEVAEKVFNLRLAKAVEEWADKLRKVYKVKVYLTDLD